MLGCDISTFYKVHLLVLAFLMDSYLSNLEVK